MAKLRIKGLKKIRDMFRRRPDQVQRLTALAINAEAESIITDAKELTPVDLGTLRSTGHVKPLKLSRNKITVSFGFGGPSAEYALFVHEDLNAFHDNGQAKFLSIPFSLHLPGMSKRIAKRVERGLT